MIPDIVLKFQLFHPNKLAENKLERNESLLVKDEYSKLLQQKVSMLAQRRRVKFEMYNEICAM